MLASAVAAPAASSSCESNAKAESRCASGGLARRRDGDRMGRLRYLASKLRHLPGAWLQPFLQDCIFYAIMVSMLFWLLQAPALASAPGFERIVMTCTATLAWAWVLIFGYELLARVPCVRQRCLITEGKLVEELRSAYNVPAHVSDSLSFADMAPNVLANQLLYFGLAAIALALCADFSAPAAPLIQVLADIFLLMVLFDILLSVAHRLLHTHLYFWHKQHHQQHASRSLGGWYMHPMDMLIELWIPIFVPLLVLRANWLTTLCWMFLVEWDGVHSHAALHFASFVPGPTRHWLHHTLFTCNYGPGLGDYLMDTEVAPASAPSRASKGKPE